MLRARISAAPEGDLLLTRGKGAAAVAQLEAGGGGGIACRVRGKRALGAAIWE
jgi:hypothetical protein